jgi:uncharacterized RDD family membrane protein YckC
VNTDNTAVLYRKQDYPGLIVRLLIDIVDISAVFLVAMVSFVTVFAGVVEDDVFFGRLIFVLGLVYLGPWKATRYGTLGYLLFRVKIVNAQGARISFWQASGRAFLMFFGPLNYLFDLFWLYGETPRQALRDKLAGTYLIKRHAQVEAQGKTVLKVLHVMGYRMQVEEIQRIGDVSAPAPAGKSTL